MIDHKDFYKSTAWEHKRQQILDRDNYECQRCKREGKFAKAVVVHHIKHLKDRPDLALDDDNLESLCEACHNREHPEKWLTPPENTKAARFPERW